MLNIRQSPLTAILRDTSVTVLALLTLAFAHPARAQTYTVTDLGPNVMPRAVNIKGQVACEHPAALLLWSSGRSIVLKSGTFFKRACAINAIGQVVGSYDTGVIGPDGYSITHAFLWSPTVANGDGGTFTDLNETLAADSGWSLTSARDINDAGQITGEGTYTSPDGTIRSEVDYLWELDAERFGKVTYVPMGPSDNENPSSLNNLAPPQVVGSIGGESFIWQASAAGLTPLGHLGMASTQAWAINDLGQVVGISDISAFLWTPGGTDGVASNPQMRNLHPATGVQTSKAFDINNSGLVVGVGIYSPNGAYFGFSWERTTGWRDLNKVSIKPANWQLQFARGCNDRTVNGLPSAQIISSGYIAVTTTVIVRKKKTTTTKNEPHGFLLTPQ